MKKVYLLILMSLIMTACEKEINFTGGYPEDKLYIYGFLEADSCVSVQYGKTNKPNSWNDKKLDNASISIMVNGKEVLSKEVVNSDILKTDIKVQGNDIVEVKLKVSGFETASGSVKINDKAYKPYSYKLEYKADTTDANNITERLYLSMSLKGLPTEETFFRVMPYMEGKFGNDNHYSTLECNSFKLVSENITGVFSSSLNNPSNSSNNKYMFFSNKLFGNNEYRMKAIIYEHTFSLDYDEPQLKKVNAKIVFSNIDKDYYLFLQSLQRSDQISSSFSPNYVYSNIENGYGVVTSAKNTSEYIVLDIENK